MKYTVVLTKDEDGGFDAVIPALPGCRTWGRTKRQAIAHASEAVEGYIEALIKDGEPIPMEVDTASVEVT